MKIVRDIKRKREAAISVADSRFLQIRNKVPILTLLDFKDFFVK